MEITETARLRYIPFTLDLMRAAQDDRARLEVLLGASIPASWPGPDLREALPTFIASQENAPDDIVWNGLVIHKADSMLIGDIGFMGGPDEQGSIEIGYSIVPEYRNQGYATEMVGVLLEWATREPGITTITALTLPDNASSIKVLEKVGMQRIGQNAEYVLWELHKEDITK